MFTWLSDIKTNPVTKVRVFAIFSLILLVYSTIKPFDSNMTQQIVFAFGFTFLVLTLFKEWRLGKNGLFAKVKPLLSKGNHNGKSKNIKQKRKRATPAGQMKTKPKKTPTATNRSPSKTLPKTNQNKRTQQAPKSSQNAPRTNPPSMRKSGSSPPPLQRKEGGSSPPPLKPRK